jgi:hypothetical protein
MFKAGQGQQALQIVQQVKNPAYADRVKKVQAGVKYEMEDFGACKTFVDQCAQDDPDIIFNQACLFYKARFFNATSMHPASGT